MNTQAKRTVAVIITFLILLSACTPATKPLQTEPPTDTSEEPVPTGINLEQEFVGKVMGGIFYTQNSNDLQEREYSERRKDSVRLLSDSIVKMVKDASVVSAGLEEYKNYLLGAMDSISTDSGGTIFEITQGILAYEIALHSSHEQIERILSARPQDDLSEAALSMFLLETVSRLVNDQQDYLSWLMGSTEAAFTLIERTSEDNASEFLESGVVIFSRDIAEPFKQLLRGYHHTSEIYTYILSADYHAAEFYLHQIQQRLGLLDPQRKESMQDIIDLYYEISKADRRLPIIIDLSEDEVVSGQTPQIKAVLTSFPATSVVQGDRDDYYTNTIAMLLLFRLHLRLNDPDEEGWSIESVFLEDLLLNTHLTENIRATYDDLSDVEEKSQARGRFIQAIDSGALPDQDRLDEVSSIKEQVASMENAVDPKRDRQGAIDQISLGQSALHAFAFIGDDARYSMMIEMINAVLADGKSNGLDNEKIKNISNLMNNDLEELLGDQKSDFIHRITTMQAEALLDAFDEWKKNTVNFSELSFGRDDLIRLVGALGLDVASAPETAEPPLPAPPAVRGFWELIKTEYVIPQEYRAGDDKDNRTYAFEYTDGSIGCDYTRVVYDGIKKTYLTELIDTSGGWSMANDDGAYLPDERVKLTLTANIEHFQRLTAAESGGGGTNFSGVAVWAYIGSIRTPFGNASSGVLESVNGDSVCRATISDGKITVPSATLEVSGVFGQGKDEDQKVLFVVVSNQGRFGGVKYIYKYLK